LVCAAIAEFIFVLGKEGSLQRLRSQTLRQLDKT
jgi:hypothetical protein